MKGNATRAGGGYTWFREFIIKFIVVALLDVPTFGFFTLVGALWCLWDRDNQCLWDKLASTYVAYSPNGFRPRTDRELAAAGHAPPTINRPNREHGGAPVINIFNQNGSGNVQGRVGTIVATGARLGIIEQGQRRPDIRVSAGSALVVGRGQDAQVRLADRRASRHHLQVGVQNGAWVVRDLGSTNMAQVIAGELKGQFIGGTAVQLRSGQLRIGQSILTLYPVEGGPW